MDTVISNKYSSVLVSLNVEISKKLEGEYEVDEIISTFGNYFFNKMFLDITAIKDYKSLTNLQKLSMNINMDKVILLLDADDPISDSKVFLSKLVSMGIYNFTKDQSNLMYLYTNPNTYRDVAYLQEIEDSQSEQKNQVNESQIAVSKKIIGVKNVTDSAGSTTLIYLLKKALSDYYTVMALEIDKRDLTFFKDKNTLTIRDDEIDRVIAQNNNVDIFLIDLNKTKKDYLCTDTIYLIEPSTIKLSKLVLVNPSIFRELSGKKVILNKSLLDESDIADFEVEANIRTYYNIPPLNDKKDNNKILLPLLNKMGYVNLSEDDEYNESKTKGIFKLFK